MHPQTINMLSTMQLLKCNGDSVLYLFGV